MLGAHDYATTCLLFTGFLLVGFIYKFYRLYSRKTYDKKSIFIEFFKYFYTLETRKFHVPNILHLIFRSINFFGLSWLLIISADFAVRAQINFGIISTCMSISTPLNCILGIIFWKEHLKLKMIISTVIILAGVTWLSFARESP